MSAITELFDGLADGVTVNESNTAFQTSTGAVDPTADTTRKYQGTGSVRFAPSATTSALGHTFTGTVQAHYSRFYLRVETLPSATHTLHWRRDPGNTANPAEVRLTTTGALQLRNSSAVQVAITTTTIPTSQWVRVELATVSGTATVRLYLDPASTTPTEEISGAYASLDLGRAGVGVQTSSTVTLNVDAYEGSDTGWVGPLPPPPAAGTERWGYPA